MAGTLALLARDARRAGAKERALAIALLLLLPACFGPIVAIRAQLFSLPLFAACALLLRAEARAPSRRIWLLVPLLALWGNLHGAVLTGAAVAGAYLVFERGRRRPGESVAVMLASALALCANPALWHTPSYVLGVLHNEAARQAIGLWAPLSLHSWLDIAFALAAVGAARGRACARARARGSSWRSAGLALLTLHAARGGMWLALFAVPLAASGFGGQARRERLPRLARPVALALLVAVAIGLAHGPLPSGATPQLVARTLALAHGTPVLAEDLLAEQVADAGGRVWVANPIDAFSTRISASTSSGCAACPRATPRSRTRRARCSCASAARPNAGCAANAGFRRVASDVRAVLYARVSARPSRAGGSGGVVPGLDLDVLGLGVGQHVQGERAQMVVVDEQLERVVPGLVEAHAVHLQDQRRRADRHARERRVARRRRRPAAAARNRRRPRPRGGA